MLFSTHITADLDRIGDYVTLIHGGRIVRTGTKDEVLDAYRVVRGGPDDLSDLVGVELIGPRRTATGAQALVRTEEAELLGGHVLVEAPTLEEIAVHIGSSSRAAAPVRNGRRRGSHERRRPHGRAGSAHRRAVPLRVCWCSASGRRCSPATAGRCSCRRSLLLVTSQVAAYPFLVADKAGLETLYAVLPVPRRAVLHGHYAWALACFAATAAVGTAMALLLARARSVPFGGRELLATC